MSDHMNRTDESLVELTGAEMEQVHGGDDELSTPVDDPEVGAGTLIPVKVKHNV